MADGPWLELPGDWTSPRLLVRILYTIGSDWELTERGLEDPSTGAVCQVAMGPPDADLIARIAAHDDLVFPSLTPDRLESAAGHKAVLTVTPGEGLEGAAACRALLACGAALIDAGAQAVWVGTGVSHGPERWQEMAAADGSDSIACYRAFVRPLRRTDDGWRSTGLAWFGHLEIVVDGDVAEPYAYDIIDALGQRLVAGPGLEGGEVLQPGRAGPRLQVRRRADPADASREVWWVERA